MRSLRSKTFSLLLLLAAVLLLGGGTYGLVSLGQASGTLVPTAGVIDRLHSTREYRYRKMRVHQEMQISYTAGRYGIQRVTKEAYWPFYRVGDRIKVLYDPVRPRDVRLPSEERLVWIAMEGVGLLCLAGAWGLWGISRRKERSYS